MTLDLFKKGKGSPGKGKTFLGLDIGSRFLKLVEVKRESRGYRLLCYGVEELPPEAIVGKEIMDRQVVIDKLNELRERCAPTSNRVVINIAGRGVIVKKITMPLVSDKEIHESVQWQLRENIPFDLSDVSWDYKVLRKDEVTEEMEILLVAAKNDAVYNLLDIVRSSGFKPVVIDLDPMALLNLLAAIDYINEEERYAVINVGYESTSVLLVSGGTYAANREIPIASKVYIEALMRFMDLSSEKASSVLLGDEENGFDPEDVKRIAESIHEKMAEHLERLFPVFRPESSNGNHLDRIYLSGGGATIVNLREFLSKRYNKPVEIVDPLSRFKVDDGVISEEDQSKLSPLFSTALGLALRKAGKPRIAINLLPFEERELEKPPFMTVPEAVLTVIPPLLVAAFVVGTSIKVSSQTRKLKARLVEVKAEQEIYRKKVGELKVVETKRNEIKQRIQLLGQLAEGRYVPVKVLNELNRILPDGVWLTQIAVEEEMMSGSQRLRIKGAALSFFDLTDLLDILTKSRAFGNVDLVQSSKEEKEGQSVINFELVVVTNPELKRR